MSILDGKPPANTMRINKWADLPPSTSGATYLVEHDGRKPFTIHVQKHQQQMIEGLMLGPIFAASICRLSDQVLPLREIHGVKIKTKIYRNDPITGRQKYGVYFLTSKVTRLPSEKEAA